MIANAIPTSQPIYLLATTGKDYAALNGVFLVDVGVRSNGTA